MTLIDNNKIPRWLWLALALMLLLSLWGPNTTICLFAVFTLVVGIALLWRSGEPPILLFIFLYQWIQSATGALYGNFWGITLDHVAPFSGRHEFASGAMIAGTLVLALAMRAAAGKPIKDLHLRMKLMFSERLFSFWLKIYVVAWLFSTACKTIAPSAGGLQVLLLSLSEIKWGAFVLLTFAAFVSHKVIPRRTWLIVFFVEFVISIGGYFSSFTEVIVYAFCGLAACNVRPGPRITVAGAVLAVAVMALGLIWTAVKEDYRYFINAGSGQQVVLVGYSERIQKLGELVSRLDASALDTAADNLAKRVMYHQLFANAVDYVPAIEPHTGGQIWFEAVTRAVTPRLLFPDKRAINDSDLTNRYSNLHVSTSKEGTSISLGYMAEAYIDFGTYLMFAAIAALGAGLGLYYRWLLNQRNSMAVIGAALAPFALMPAHLAETSSLKMVPSMILSLLVCIIALRILAPMALSRPPRLVARSV